MKLGLGIDTGGTYTDAVIMDLSEGKVLASNKALTTHSNLIEGIENVIAGLDQEYLEHVRLVSVSTTLATNSTLEGKGHAAGLILSGYSVSGEVPARYMVSVNGGHDSKGNEIGRLDLEAVEEFVNSTMGRLSSYAVSSYFAIRNPEHELAIKESVERLTSKPVVCGHELSLDLGQFDQVPVELLHDVGVPELMDLRELPGQVHRVPFHRLLH